jgi:hypothetical protein
MTSDEIAQEMGRGNADGLRTLLVTIRRDGELDGSRVNEQGGRLYSITELGRVHLKEYEGENAG